MFEQLGWIRVIPISHYFSDWGGKQGIITSTHLLLNIINQNRPPSALRSNAATRLLLPETQTGSRSLQAAIFTANQF